MYKYYFETPGKNRSENLASLIQKINENRQCGQYFVAHICSKQIEEFLLPL